MLYERPTPTSAKTDRHQEQMAAAAPTIPWAPRATRPLIACSSSELREKASVTRTEHGEPPQREIALALQYTQAVEQAGGVPVIVPPLAGATIDPLLDCASGLLLSGGPDIHPSAYGEEPDPQLGPAWPELDSIELAITRQALERGMPILAVCRGLQLLNVARGGTLVQHLPDRVGERVHHRQDVSGGRTTHWVRDRARVAARRDPRPHPHHGQLVPPPGRRPPRRGARPHGVGQRRDDRGPRGPVASVRRRRAVARRVAGQPPPARRAVPAFVQAAARYSAQRHAPAAVSAVA